MTAPGTREIFWEFSQHRYGQADIEAALLALQDEAGADVTLVLYVLWRAASGYRLDAASLAEAEAAAAPWRDQVVRPLRGIRRAMKALAAVPGAPALRAGVQADELQAERLQHALLQAHAGDTPGLADPSSRAAALAGLSAYAALLGVRFPDAALAALTTPTGPSA